MEFREFIEYSNPEENDYDITSSLNNDKPINSDEERNFYFNQMFDLIGILEDVTEEEVMENYGITLQEYFNPNAEVIRKITEKLNTTQQSRKKR